MLEHGGDEDQAIAGLLHDAIEDADVTEHDIAIRFGLAVASMVSACTDSTSTPKPAWATRKRAYLAHLASTPANALGVSLADKVHNARAIATDVEDAGEPFLARFSAGATGTRWYYRRLFEAFSARSAELSPALVHELGVAVARFGATADAALAWEAAAD